MSSPNKKARRGPWILLLILIAGAVLVYFEISGGVVSGAFSQSRKRLLPEGIVFEYPSEPKPVFSAGRNGFWRVTKDGASFYSYKGEYLRNVTYTMQAPFIVKNGDNWAFLEPGGRYVCVCGPDGFLYEVTTDYPILSAYINKISCLMLTLDRGDSYEIRIYNAAGEPSGGWALEMDGVYPVSAALTDDGLMYCVSYLDTSKSALSSRILYFYTDSGAKRYGTDDQAPFKAIEKPGAVAARLWFNNNNRLGVITDGEVFVTSAKGEEIFSYKLENQLADYSFDDNLLAIVAGPSLPNSVEPLNRGDAILFDYDGNKLAEYSLETEDINIYGGLVLLKNSESYILTDSKGHELWFYGASGDITALLPIDKNKALIAKTGIAEIYSYKLPKGNDDDS